VCQASLFFINDNEIDFSLTDLDVTTVGATWLPSGSSIFEPEVAGNIPASGFSSGGGFSNIYVSTTLSSLSISLYNMLKIRLFLKSSFHTDASSTATNPFHLSVLT